MPSCKKCGEEISVWRSFNWHGICKKCYPEYEEEIDKDMENLEKVEKATEILLQFCGNKDESYCEVFFEKYDILFEDVINNLIKNNFDLNKTILEIDEDDEDLLRLLEVYKLKRRVKRTKVREEAEKEVYGKVKSERTPIKEKEAIFRKFDNKCAVCGEMEGLHIHHKDEDATNNRVDNLIVLCGVCHKKIHMKVR